MSLNLDWWEIITEGTIQTPVRQDLLDNPDLFASNFIRDESGALSAIDMRYINAGERNTSGVELGMQINGELGEGLWDIHFNGSYLIEDRKKLLDNVPFGDNLVGTHSRGNIPLRWKHSLAFNYAHGDWRHNVTQIFRDSYEDEVPAGIQSGAISINEVEDYSPMVSSYLIYNYSVSYTGFKDIGLTFGIKNLFDRDPPFTAINDYSRVLHLIRV